MLYSCRGLFCAVPRKGHRVSLSEVGGRAVIPQPCRHSMRVTGLALANSPFRCSITIDRGHTLLPGCVVLVLGVGKAVRAFRPTSVRCLFSLRVFNNTLTPDDQLSEKAILDFSRCPSAHFSVPYLLTWCLFAHFLATLRSYFLAKFLIQGSEASRPRAKTHALNPCSRSPPPLPPPSPRRLRWRCARRAATS